MLNFVHDREPKQNLNEDLVAAFERPLIPTKPIRSSKSSQYGVKLQKYDHLYLPIPLPDGLLTVEKILKRVTLDHEDFFLIKWIGYDISKNTL